MINEDKILIRFLAIQKKLIRRLLLRKKCITKKSVGRTSGKFENFWVENVETSLIKNVNNIFDFS